MTDNTCIDSTRGACGAIEGASFKGNLSVCPADGMCGMGVCCFATTDPGGECTGPIDPFNCAFSDGMYLGNGTDCGTSTCSPFGGGCCCGGFSCFVTTQDGCPGSCAYLGDGIACGAMSACPGVGACCGPTGLCIEVNGFSCVQSDGQFHGEGTACTPDPCGGGPPLGACCSAAGCQVLTFEQCQTAGAGPVWGQGQTCESFCPGTCCLQEPNPHCVNLPQSVCTGQGGQFIGINATCPIPCQQQCFDDGDCDNGDACDGMERCTDFVCVNGDAPQCDDGNICTQDQCIPATGDCANTPIADCGACCFTSAMGPGCEDGLTQEQCSAFPFFTFRSGQTCDGVGDCLGACCTPGGGCSANVPEGFCEALAFGLAGAYRGDGTQCCEDGDACNGMELCDIQGHCLPGTPPNCDDGIDCTIDDCDAVAGCARVPSDAFCLDEDLCTLNERCDLKSGCVSDTRNCNDFDPCTDDLCAPQTGCVHPPKNCDDGVACTDDSCNAVTGACVHTPNDALCLDEDGCTENERCDAVLGCVSDPKHCADAHACTTDGCVSPAGACVHAPVDEACDDGKACTVDTCDPNIGCLNGAEDSLCEDGDPCTVDDCRPADANADADGCIHPMIDCGDFDECTLDSCDPNTGECVNADRDCDDGLDCTTDLCDPTTGCKNDRIEGCCKSDDDCNDGDDCTVHSCDAHLGCVLIDYLCGACCVDGLVFECLDTAPDSCDSLSGDFRGIGTRCDNLAPPCMGACCRTGRACAETTPDECAGDGGHFFGMGTTCDNEPCGACCTPDLGCRDGAVAGECAEAADSFFQNALCAEVPCGACCDANDDCTDGALESECSAAGNDFRGPGSQCTGLVLGDCGAICVNDSHCRTDSDPCMGPERCVDGNCVPGERTDCDDGDDCTDDSCDPHEGCVNDRIEGCCNEDDDCDDGDPCTVERCDPQVGCVVFAFVCGACCRVGEPCIDDVTAEACSGAFDTFFGAGSLCDTSSCGACCHTGTGHCTDGLTEAECESADRAHQGPNTACAFESCDGACCLPDGSCVVTPGEQCTGMFRGVGTDCAELNPPCEPFGGACCLDNDDCVAATEDTCRDVHNGRFLGDTTRCDDVDCALLGACCLGDGGDCIHTTQNGCPEDGIFQFPGSRCPDACIGACCHPLGVCTVVPLRNCFGDYRGDGTDCAELEPPCDPFDGGACCLSDGSCIAEVSEDTCFFRDGMFQGTDTTCVTVECPCPGGCDDGVECTVDTCGGGGFAMPTAGDGCNHDPDNARCGDGEICDPMMGCVPDCGDTEPPFIVHNAGMPGSTRPCSGYIDPRIESSDGVALDHGLTHVDIVFNEPVFHVGGGPVDESSFEVTETGGGLPPAVISVVKVDPTTYTVTLTRIITLQEWTTIRAVVEDACGNPIINSGPGGDADEPDRTDIGFLPGDVTQNGATQPTDLISLRQAFAGGFSPPCGPPANYFDIDRNAGPLQPVDLIRFRQIVAGTAPATRNWLQEKMNALRP